MNTVENTQGFKPYIDDEFIVFHHHYGENKNYKVAIKASEIVEFDEDYSWGNSTRIVYKSETSYVLETFDEVMNIIKEYNMKNIKNNGR